MHRAFCEVCEPRNQQPRDAHRANTAMYAPTQSLPPPIRDGSVIGETIDSKAHSGFVPRHSAQRGSAKSRLSDLGLSRVAHTSRFLRCVRAAKPAAPGRTQGKHRHVCATQSLPPTIRDGSAVGEAVDSRTHSGFVPQPSGALTYRTGRRGSPYIALFAMCASRETSSPGTHTGQTPPCMRHPIASSHNPRLVQCSRLPKNSSQMSVVGEFEFEFFFLDGPLGVDFAGCRGQIMSY